MEEIVNKLSVRERIQITRRGFGILNHYCPGLPQGKALSALVSSLQPFAAIWFSAQIINELFGEKRIKTLVIYVSAVLVINFVAAIIKNGIDKVTDQKEAQMWIFFEKVFSDKQMSMDFADLENAQIQHQRKKAHENLFMFGNGLAELVWGTAGLVNASVSIIVSVTMTITLFTQKTGTGWMDSPFWIAGLLSAVFLGGLCNQKMTIRENKVFKKWCDGTVWFNRCAMFFGWELYMNQDRAKDVRMYEQHIIADREHEKMAEHNRNDNPLIVKMSLLQAVSAFAVGVGNAVCYLYVVLKAFGGAFGVGNIVQYVGALSWFGAGIQEIMFIWGDNEAYCVHLQGLFDYLDIPNKKYQGTLPVEKRAFCDGGDNDYDIEFRNVSFHYPGSEQYALRNVSMRLKIGRELAIVGMNGSGKTTFIKLLCRLYDPTEGEILLNGVNIKKYDYDEYMSIFSVVFQDFKLFSFSLGQNVAADVPYDKAKVEYCLKKAGFGDRLSKMKDGIDTSLYKDFQEDGVAISGGEAQKIAIARALYKDAPFVVLDEPTAALDPVAEAEIYGKFNEMIGDKTGIYISHRLSSCKFCDEIAVFHNGAVIQKGTHDELLADTSGEYTKLWHAQAQYYTAPALNLFIE